MRVIRIKNLKLIGVQDNRDSDEAANPGVVAQFVLDGGVYEAVLDTETLPKGEFEFAIVAKSNK